MSQQLELIFEQPDVYHLAKQEYEDALQEKKALETLILKMEMVINSTIKEKQIRMQSVCNHSEKHVEEFENMHQCITEYTEYCDICGKILRSW